MKNVVRLVVAVLVSMGAFAMAPGADARDPRPPVTPHKHLLELPGGAQVAVGPDVCANPSLQTAFENYHYAVHVGNANTAFDHAHNPVDIKFGGLC